MVVPKTMDNPGPSIDDKIRSVGDDLARTFRMVLEAVPGRPSRPNQLARELGLNRAVSSRVLSATSKKDPMEVTHIIPGPESLRSLLEAAAGRDVESELILAAEAAVHRFDELIRNDAGTRSALDAIISATLPGAREKFELASKYSIYKGMGQLKGVQSDVWLGTAIVTPSTTGVDRHDLTWLTGALGIQRLRSNVTVRFSYRSLRDDNSAGEASDAMSVIPMTEFCTNPPAEILTQRLDEVVNYTLGSDRVGPQYLTDMLVVDHHVAAMRSCARDSERKQSSLFVEPAFPVNMLIFDMLLHRDAFPGVDPTLVIYDTGTKGIANVNDPARDMDRMELQESIEFLGQGLGRMACAEVPRYSEMLQHLSGHFGWDASAYRGYRCRMQYPVYGWQISMAFEPPEA